MFACRSYFSWGTAERGTHHQPTMTLHVTVQGERPALLSCQDAHFSKNSQEGGKFGRKSYKTDFLSSRLPVNSGSFSGVSPPERLRRIRVLDSHYRARPLHCSATGAGTPGASGPGARAAA